ncbi:hypothetical protein KSP39_PZI005408 [Platanthera zijinensis]|uniref:Exocyst subunit Exo70 family protein n=1 Tax=Platanthera zijinensis TaxID=2320716 RepID=A0AAP0BTC7_9ASPA
MGTPVFEAVEQVILRWESSESVLWEASEKEIAEYLDAVDELMYRLELGSSEKEHIARARAALQLAMERLEDEFRHLLIRVAVPIDAGRLHRTIRTVSISLPRNPSDGAENFEEPKNPNEPKIELVLPEVISDLKEIADRMFCAGYGKEISQVYIGVRRDILHEYLSILGFEDMSIEEVQKTGWKDLDGKMKKWILALKTTVRVLMEEKTISEQIFAASQDLSEESFTLAAKCSILQILNFGDAISISPKSAEKIFRTIEAHEALADAITDLQPLFSSSSKHVIFGEAEGILKRLGEAVRCIFREFSNSVQKEDSGKPLQGGDIHPLTRYVMNYAKLLLEYSNSLDMILDGEHIPEELQCGGDDDQLMGDRTPLTRRLLLLMSYLESNLEMKSKDYEDKGLQCIFMMNNLLYIVQKVQQSKLVAVFGDHWVRRRRGKVKRFATSYLRASWSKTWSHLMDSGLGGIRGRIFNASTKMDIKESFKRFNIGFEEIYRSQTSWKVSDLQLREELRISIAEMIIPAYRSFFGRFGSQLEGGRNAAKYLKYTPDELETYLSDFFEGLPGVSNHLMRKKLSFHHTLAASHG